MSIQPLGSEHSDIMSPCWIWAYYSLHLQRGVLQLVCSASKISYIRLVIGGSLFAEARYGPFFSLLSLLPCIRRPSIFCLTTLGKNSVLYMEKHGIPSVITKYNNSVKMQIIMACWVQTLGSPVPFYSHHLVRCILFSAVFPQSLDGLGKVCIMQRWTEAPWRFIQDKTAWVSFCSYKWHHFLAFGGMYSQRREVEAVGTWKAASDIEREDSCTTMKEGKE